MKDERRYEGVSPDGNLQEALGNALQQLQNDIAEGGVRDASASWRLVEIRGQHGGFAGRYSVVAEITATRAPGWD